MLFLTPNVALLLSRATFRMFGTLCCCTASDRANQTQTERTRRVQYNEGDATSLRDHHHDVIHQDLPDPDGGASVDKVCKRHLQYFCNRTGSPSALHSPAAVYFLWLYSNVGVPKTFFYSSIISEIAKSHKPLAARQKTQGPLDSP